MWRMNTKKVEKLVVVVVGNVRSFCLKTSFFFADLSSAFYHVLFCFVLSISHSYRIFKKIIILRKNETNRERGCGGVKGNSKQFCCSISSSTTNETNTRRVSSAGAYNAKVVE